MKKLISLAWKGFRRSSYFQMNLAIRILIILGFIYFGGIALFMGIASFYIIKKALDVDDPLIIVNSFLIYWFLADLLIRFFMQQLPVMNIKPYLILPFKRSKIIRYLLTRTGVSFFNILPLLFFVPFSIVLIVEGYSILGSFTWFLSMLCLVFSNNFINFLINKTNAYFYGILALTAALVALEAYNIFKITSYADAVFNAFYEQSYVVILPVGLLYLTYKLVYNYIRKHFYVDGAISKKEEKISKRDFTWLDRFGKMGFFLKNDLKLITRNVRPRQVVLMSFLFLFYGLIFYTQDIYRDMQGFITFASIFVTGGFLLSFGQYVPAWDSEYYKLMMSQNISYKKYLESKWSLMTTACFLSFILSVPYLYFGWEIFSMIAAGASFNIGLNSFITLYGGALNRQPMKLNEKAKAFSNTQAFSPTQLIITIPKLVGPIILFYVPYKIFNYEAGIITLAASGIVGLLLKDQFLNFIEKTYQKGKYKTIAAFDEKQ